MINIHAIFRDNSNEELKLYSISIDEDSDSIKINTQIRQSVLKRGSVGDLVFISKNTLDNTDIKDIHRDMLLQRVEVYREEIGEPTEWKYIFLKN